MHHQLQFEAALRKWDALTKLTAPKTTGTASTPPPSAPSSSTSTAAVFDLVNVDDRLVIPSWNVPEISKGSVSSSGSDCAAAVLEQVHLCLGQSLASSTMSLYQAVLSKSIQAAEAALHTKFLPLATEDDCVQLFGHLKVQDGSALHWAKVRTLKAAICQWHARHSLASPFDKWTPRLRAFWTGLAKLCLHSGARQRTSPV